MGEDATSGSILSFEPKSREKILTRVVVDRGMDSSTNVDNAAGTKTKVEPFETNDYHPLPSSYRFRSISDVAAIHDGAAAAAAARATTAVSAPTSLFPGTHGTRATADDAPHGSTMSLYPSRKRKRTHTNTANNRIYAQVHTLPRPSCWKQLLAVVTILLMDSSGNTCLVNRCWCHAAAAANPDVQQRRWFKSKILLFFEELMARYMIAPRKLVATAASTERHLFRRSDDDDINTSSSRKNHRNPKHGDSQDVEQQQKIPTKDTRHGSTKRRIRQETLATQSKLPNWIRDTKTKGALRHNNINHKAVKRKRRTRTKRHLQRTSPKIIHDEYDSFIKRRFLEGGSNIDNDNVDKAVDEKERGYNEMAWTDHLFSPASDSVEISNRASSSVPAATTTTAAAAADADATTTGMHSYKPLQYDYYDYYYEDYYTEEETAATVDAYPEEGEEEAADHDTEEEANDHDYEESGKYYYEEEEGDDGSTPPPVPAPTNPPATPAPVRQPTEPSVEDLTDPPSTSAPVKAPTEPQVEDPTDPPSTPAPVIPPPTEPPVEDLTEPPTTPAPVNAPTEPRVEDPRDPPTTPAPAVPPTEPPVEDPAESPPMYDEENPTDDPAYALGKETEFPTNSPTKVFASITTKPLIIETMEPCEICLITGSYEPTVDDKEPRTGPPESVIEEPNDTTPPPVPETEKPTESPTRKPAVAPTPKPTAVPTPSPTVSPSRKPTVPPTTAPSRTPTETPTTSSPFSLPSQTPTKKLTGKPTFLPSRLPTRKPTIAPTTSLLTTQPTLSPTMIVPETMVTTDPLETPAQEPTPVPYQGPQPTPWPTPQPVITPAPQPTSPPVLPQTPQPTPPPALPQTPQPTPPPALPQTPQPTLQPVLPQPTPRPTRRPVEPQTPPQTPRPTPRPTQRPVPPQTPPTLRPTPRPTPRPATAPPTDPVGLQINPSASPPPYAEPTASVVQSPPTLAPTRQTVPQASPTSAPVIQTAIPGLGPLVTVPTEAPTTSRLNSFAPTRFPLETLTLPGVELRIGLSFPGGRMLQTRSSRESQECIEIWRVDLEDRIEEAVISANPGKEMVDVAITNISVSRLLEPTTLIFIFDILVKIRSPKSNHDIFDYFEAVFDTDVKRQAYLGHLRGTGCGELIYTRYLEIFPPEMDEPPDIEEQPVGDSTSSKNSAANIGLIVGIIIAVVAAAMLIALVIYVKCNGKSEFSSDGGNQPLSNNQGEQHEYASQIGFRASTDVSTLSDPLPLGAAMQLGDTSTIGSFDYDYQKAYQPSVSEVSGSVRDSLSNALLSADDDTLDLQYAADELIQVSAPAGMLGLVLETNDFGMPTVYNIKISSPLYGQVNAGDRLLSVDGEDVSVMLASDVSKLIASRARNAERKFVFARSVKPQNALVDLDTINGETHDVEEKKEQHIHPVPTEELPKQSEVLSFTESPSDERTGNYDFWNQHTSNSGSNIDV